MVHALYAMLLIFFFFPFRFVRGRFFALFITFGY